MSDNQDGERGSALVWTLLVVFSLLGLTAASLLSSSSDTKISSNYQSGTQALLAWGAALHGDGERSRRLWAVIEAEEAKGGLAFWQAERDVYAARIPEGPAPDSTPSLDEAVAEALAVD